LDSSVSREEARKEGDRGGGAPNALPALIIKGLMEKILLRE
jgi:hypothetical protein